jgi:uncharacterized protein
MNPLGLDTLQRLVPVYETDLNRNFPSQAQGPLPRRIAAAAICHLRDAALVIDIHASNIFLREIPQVRINQTFADMLVPLARHMNVDLIWVHGAVTVLEATMVWSKWIASLLRPRACSSPTWRWDAGCRLETSSDMSSMASMDTSVPK